MNDDYYGVKRMHENRCWHHYNASVLVDSVTQHGNWNIGYIDASLVLIDMIHAYIIIALEKAIINYILKRKRKMQQKRSLLYYVGK